MNFIKVLDLLPIEKFISQMIKTSGLSKNPKIFRELPGIQYIFPLHHVNKPDKFQRVIINRHLFTSICFQCGPTQPQNCP